MSSPTTNRRVTALPNFDFQRRPHIASDAGNSVCIVPTATALTLSPFPIQPKCACRRQKIGENGRCCQYYFAAFRRWTKDVDRDNQYQNGQENAHAVFPERRRGACSPQVKPSAASSRIASSEYAATASFHRPKPNFIESSVHHGRSGVWTIKSSSQCYDQRHRLLLYIQPSENNVRDCGPKQ